MGDFVGSTCGGEEEKCATPGAQGCQCGLLQPEDTCIGHGTQVAGIVAGASVGVAKNATVVAVAVMDCDGTGYESDVLAGMNFVIDSKRDEPDIRTVMVMSVGGPRPMASYRDPAKDPKFTAVQAASELDVVVVVAAGYESIDVRYKSPAYLATVVTVCGVNDKQELTDSNYGRNVDVCAPGHQIISASTGGSPVDARYSTSSGTSFAAPFVAGALALLLQDNDWTFEQQVGELLTHCVLTDVVDMKELPTQVVPNRLLNLGGAQCAATVAGQDADPESPPETIVEKSDTWTLHEGTCLLRGACITSPNFPDKYATYEFCNFTHHGSRVRVKSFDVETGYDVLTVHGYSAQISDGVVFEGGQMFEWVSDGSTEKKGWELCDASLSTTTSPTTPPTPTPPTVAKTVPIVGGWQVLGKGDAAEKSAKSGRGGKR